MSQIALTITFLTATLFAGVANAFCFQEAGERYNINPLVLYAIAKQESGFNPAAYNRKNKDGSYDFSLMQINSTWLPILAKLGISEADLIQNPCLSVQVGAWILAQNMQHYGSGTNEFWAAVGAYNAGVSKKNHNKRMNYAWLIYNHMAASAK